MLARVTNWQPLEGADDSKYSSVVMSMEMSCHEEVTTHLVAKYDQ